MATWAERAAQWVYGTPYEQSPLFDPTGANCAVNQQGPVWYIARIAGPPVFSGTRSCTIPRHKAVFLYIGAVVDSYPCPDPNWHPAPGQSLSEFMLADAKAGMDLVDHLEASLDGPQLRQETSYTNDPDDLRARGRIEGERPGDAALVDLIIDEYIRFPAPASAA